MRKLITGSVVVIILLILALLVAPIFIPAHVYKEQVVRQVEAATGRTLTINGAMGLRLLPRVQLTLEDVALSNPPGFAASEDAPMMTLGALRVSVSLFELLKGRVDVDRFKLVDPVIALARDAHGKANWEFSPKDDDALGAAEDAAEDMAEGGFKGQITLPELTIENGTLSFRASPADETLSLDKLNLVLRLPGLSDTAELKGDALWNGTLPLAVEATIDTPQKWLDGKETAYTLNFTADGRTLELEAKGSATQDDGGPATKGRLSLAAASLKELGKSLGVELLPAHLPGKGTLDLTGDFSFAGDKLALSGLALSLDSIKLTGSASVDLDGERPAIVADLNAPGLLVLDDFMPEESDAPAAAESPATGDAGWSTEPLMTDTSALRSVDAQLALSIGGLKADKVTLGAMAIEAALRNGTASIKLPEFDFYEGKATFHATVQPTGKDSLSIRSDAVVTGADIGKFLVESQDMDRLAGKGDLKYAVSLNGRSMRDLVNTLNGTASLHMRNGAIKGFNLAEIARSLRSLGENLKAGNLGAVATLNATSGSQQTDFAELSGSFTMTNGTIANRDLALKAPLLNVTGEGTVHLPQRTVDYRIQPAVVATLEGEGREKDAAGLMVPLKVSGTFDNLKFTPDASGFLNRAAENPKEAIQELKGNVKDLKGLFKGL